MLAGNGNLKARRFPLNNRFSESNGVPTISILGNFGAIPLLGCCGAAGCLDGAQNRHFSHASYVEQSIAPTAMALKNRCT